MTRTPSSQAFVAVLVDDDPLVRENWEITAERAGFRLLTLASAEALLSRKEALSKDIPIFVDVDLGLGRDGLELAERLAGEGFTELYLATGYDADHFPPMRWLKGITGKDAPDWTALR